LERGHYERIVPHWQAALAPERLLIWEMEKADQTPEVLVERLAAFLGLDVAGFPTAQVRAPLTEMAALLMLSGTVRAALEVEYGGRNITHDLSVENVIDWRFCMLSFEDFAADVPQLHSWDNGVTWNT